VADNILFAAMAFPARLAQLQPFQVELLKEPQAFLPRVVQHSWRRVGQIDLGRWWLGWLQAKVLPERAEVEP
jgi:hypothetical protein